jgi:hypothetical protein
MARIIAIIGLLVVFSFSATAATNKKKVNVKYKQGERIDFESLLIEGEKKKADYSVVTGNIGEKDFGLLKLRDNFIDTMSDDAGEEIQ